MTKMKKLLSLLLVLAMTISLAIPAAGASDFADVSETHPYYSAIQSLVARGIISGIGDGNFAPDASIKRSEFAKMVVLSIGMTNVSTTVDATGFPDVSTDHWAAGYIKAAHGQGIINGYDDGTFKPDAEVTYEQAIAMVIRAKSVFLKSEAEKIGYPDGYIQIATRYQFLKGIIDGEKGTPAKRATIAKLMDNSIRVELPKDVGGIPTLEVDQMKEVKGQVLAVKGTTVKNGVAGDINATQFKMLTNNGDVVVFDAGKISEKDSLRSYLGKLVIVYYEENIANDIQYISSISLQRGKNYELEIGLDEISDYDNDFVTYYDDNDDEITMNVSDDAAIMYNGTLQASNVTLSSLISGNANKAGSIKFLCTEGSDSAADVIFFTSYTNVYVTSTVSSNKKVIGEVNEMVSGTLTAVKKEYEINDESRTKTVTITKDGKQVAFDSFKKGQIISISESTNAIEVLISDKTVSGVVTGKDDYRNTIKIQSKDYTFTDGLTVDSLTLGVSLKLHLDAFGKVAKYTHQMTTTNYVYGYLLKASNDGTAMAGKVAMKILKLNTTNTSTPAELYLDDVVTINNVTYRPEKNADAIITMLKDTAEYYDNDSTESYNKYDFSDSFFQPIRYSTSSNGKINALYIGTKDVEPTESDLKVNNDFVATPATCTTNGGALSFNHLYKMSSSTKVVYVPATDEEREDNTKYIIKNGNNSGLYSGDTCRVLLVDLNASSTPAVVIVYSGGSAAVSASEWEDFAPMLVTNRDLVPGEYKYMITLMDAAGTESDYYDETGDFFNAVQIGDIVRVNADNNKKIDEYEIAAKGSTIFDGSEFIQPITHFTTTQRNVSYAGATLSGTRALHAEGNPNMTTKIVMYAGVAFEIADGSMFIALDYPGTNDAWTKADLSASSYLRNITVSGARVMMVDCTGTTIEAEDVTVADVDQIYDYSGQYNYKSKADKIFVYCYGDTARLIVVYRGE